MAHLALSALQLVQQGFRLGPDVQLGVVVHQDDQVRMVDKPLSSVHEIRFMCGVRNETVISNAPLYSNVCKG